MMTEGQGELPQYGQQRRYPRIPCNRAILVSYRSDDIQQLLHGRCVTVSEGGVGAIVDGHLRPEQTVRIEFQDSGRRRAFCIDARVCYNQGFHHGFALALVDDTQRGRLRQVCDEASAWN